MRRAPRPYRQLARPSAELQVTRRDGTLEDVLAVVGVRGDREEERRGAGWTLREDPARGEPLSAASRRLLDRLVPLRPALVDLARRGAALRVLLQQAPGEGHVVPAGLFTEAASWGGRLDVDQFVVVDCGDLDPAVPGLFLDPAAVAAHAATGTDLLVGGFGTPEARPDPGWVLPWRGRVLREVRHHDGWLHVRLDDRSVLDCRVLPDGLEVTELTEIGPRPLPVGALHALHTVRSAVLWPGRFRLSGDGVQVQGRVSQLALGGRGFRFDGPRPTFSDAPAVLEGCAERGGLSLLWHPSSQVEQAGFALDVDVDVTDLHLAVRAPGPGGPGSLVGRSAQVLLDAVRAGGPDLTAWPLPDHFGPPPDAGTTAGRGLVVLARRNPSTVLRSRPSTWGGLLDAVAGVLAPTGGLGDTEPGVRFTARSELVAELLDRLPG